MAADDAVLSLRPATAADRDRVLTWRNDPEVRRASFGDAPIAPSVHAEWFADSLARADRVLLVGQLSGGAPAEPPGRPGSGPAEDEPIGLIRYDCEGETATVSVFLAPERIGSGLGSRLIDAGTRWMAEHRPEVRRIDARLLAGNERSRRAFRNAGFRGDAETLSLDVRTHTATAPSPSARGRDAD